MKPIFLIVLVLPFQWGLLIAQTSAGAPHHIHLHPAAISGLSQEMAKQDLELFTKVNPYYLRGDFNGDGQADVAVLVQHKQGHRGIVIRHGDSEESFFITMEQREKEIQAEVLVPYGIAGAEFYWYVISNEEMKEVLFKSTGKLAQPKGEAVMFGKMEAFGVHIYWDGDQYRFQAGGC